VERTASVSSTPRGKGYTDDGRAGQAVAFDLKTFKVLSRIKAEDGADGIVVDPKSSHVFVIMAIRLVASFSDVENALGNVTHLAAQQAALEEQVTQSGRVLIAAQRKYAAGYADFLAVTDAQRLLYAARDQLADVRRARLAALVTLFKALGGGW
jgi:hypothetical protein